MFNLPLFSREDSQSKPVFAPLLCWDIASINMSQRLEVHQDMTELDELMVLNQWQPDSDYKSYLMENYALIITDVSKAIVWASRAFVAMTGYEKCEIIGKKPTFLQGKRTHKPTRELINDRLSKFEPLKARILNYRKNGETYWCGLSIAPLRNQDNIVTHFIAIEKEVN
ncbi:PAS domain-containing protein [Emticicia fluvialis]|uniref:PAS domain-containing protein n=1 Tax=Emticicia fluvialis TaxID=2974474 RepID=UPI0021660108|nr:PAS domain-containing protein [Emticicia fluvialis]